MQDQGIKIQVKLKKFVSSSGLEILVGQDDKSNDTLTLKIAHPNDIWFHVNGTPGSHVVLRCGEQKITPDKSSLQEAASLAAFFSKMRDGGKVTVHYCFAKQVSKKRNAKAGSVIIKQAQKLRVQPKLLQEAAIDKIV